MRVIHVIGRSVAAELDRLGVGNDVIIAALVEEVGLSTAQARAVLRAVRADTTRDRRDTVRADDGSVS